MSASRTAGQAAYGVLGDGTHPAVSAAQAPGGPLLAVAAHLGGRATAPCSLEGVQSLVPGTVGWVLTAHGQGSHRKVGILIDLGKGGI